VSTILTKREELHRMDTSSKYLDITFERTIAIWWSFVWRSMLFSALLGAFLGLGSGAILGVLGHPELGGPVGAVLGWLGAFPVSIVVLRMVLGKEFGDFVIRLVSTK
jgi:hypothetical protein